MSSNYHASGAATKADRVVSAFEAAGRKLIDRKRLPDENGDHLRFDSGVVVLVYDTGATGVAGRNQAEARRILEQATLFQRGKKNRWKDPSPNPFNSDPARRTQVFVSYSHTDTAALSRLRVHLRPFEREDRVEVWSDTKIQAGQEWREEIDAALSRAAAAVLLVSADFLASEFVVANELPPLLEAANREGVVILPVIVKPCAFNEIASIARFQAVNDPKRPLISLNEAEQEEIWYRVAISARDALIKATERIEILAPAAPAARSVNSRASVSNEIDMWDGVDMMLGSELTRPAIVDSYFVYSYEHIDVLDFMFSAEEVLGNRHGADVFLEQIKRRLAHAGWEGDGTLQLLWLPPFIGAGVEDTYGVCIWLVKQSNNGTTWIASPVPLNFPRLRSRHLG